MRGGVWGISRVCGKRVQKGRGEERNEASRRGLARLYIYPGGCTGWLARRRQPGPGTATPGKKAKTKLGRRGDKETSGSGCESRKKNGERGFRIYRVHSAAPPGKGPPPLLHTSGRQAALRPVDVPQTGNGRGDESGGLAYTGLLQKSCAANTCKWRFPLAACT